MYASRYAFSVNQLQGKQGRKFKVNATYKNYINMHENKKLGSAFK